MVATGCGHGGSRLWSWWSWWQQFVVMVAAGCGHGGHGGRRLWSWWSWWQQVVVMVVMVVMVAAGCGHGGSRLWSWWSWWQQVVVMVVMVAAGCGHDITHGPQPTQCPHVQENEAGTITNLQLRPRRPDGRTYTACRDAGFCRQQEQMCGQQQSSYTPNSTVARRNWRRQLHSSCILDSQCSGDREEEEEEEGEERLENKMSSSKTVSLDLGSLVRTRA